ncbi:hypothetical protein LCGC14_1968240, partial [marine sediment metagenome]
MSVAWDVIRKPLWRTETPPA